MIYIFHGDATAKSRLLYQEAISKERTLGHEMQNIEGDKLSPSDLESYLTTSNLFAVSSLAIEGLLSRLRSKDKEACIDLLASYSGEKNIILWDKKEITPANLKKFAKAKISNSKADTVLFEFVENIYPGNTDHVLSLFHELLKLTNELIVFTMLVRQIGYLIIIKSATNPKFAPWQLGKLRSQAAKWENKQLEDFLLALQKIDLSIKKGASKLSYIEHLDIMLTTLLR